MNIQITTGSETFRNPSATVEIAAFYKRGVKEREMPMFIAAKDLKSGCRQINSPEFIPASPLNSNHGQWILANYAVPEGALIKIMIKKKFAGTFLYTTGQFMLLQRDRAALRRMRVTLTEHPDANVHHAYIEGRFDYIQPADFEALGIETSYMKQFEVDYTNFFEDEILERAKQALNTPTLKRVVQSSGKEVRIPGKAPKRLLTVRRP